MVDLGVCLEAVRRALVYGRDMLEYRKHPKLFKSKVGGIGRARIATEGFIEALRAIVENCPLDDYEKGRLQRMYENLKETNWETVARYSLSDDEVYSVISNALESLRDYFGFSPVKYEKYLPW